MTTNEPVQFELAHPWLGVAMPVQLRHDDGRWLATAQCLDSQLVGIGATAREALASALVPLGAAAALLMADPALFGASVQVLAA